MAEREIPEELLQAFRANQRQLEKYQRQTRERIRQIVSKNTKALREKLSSLPRQT
mgnify:CR=1 FL=1